MRLTSLGAKVAVISSVTVWGMLAAVVLPTYTPTPPIVSSAPAAVSGPTPGELQLAANRVESGYIVKYDCRQDWNRTLGFPVHMVIKRAGTFDITVRTATFQRLDGFWVMDWCKK